MYRAQRYDPETKTWICDPWDRSKQTYWISRQSNGIMRMSDNQKVCDLPKYVDIYNTVLVEKICFAGSDEDLNKILDEYIASDDYQAMLSDGELNLWMNEENTNIRKKMIEELRKDKNHERTYGIQR